ncbi:MAG: F0F1 ATP synthase subunit A [Bacteroidales bacterium]|nr:F0F1 ATP synthase subunit A [Bacteroidales bacterium]
MDIVFGERIKLAKIRYLCNSFLINSMRIKSAVLLCVFVFVQCFLFAQTHDVQSNSTQTNGAQSHNAQTNGVQSYNAQTDGAQSHNAQTNGAQTQDNKVEKSFDAGSMIIEHVLDEHQWHIATVGHHHLAVPLPIILFYEGRLYAFSSSKLDHSAVYKPEGLEAEGFVLREDAPHKGKIVVMIRNADGELEIAPTAPLDFSITKNVLELFVAAALLFLIFMLVARNYKKRGINAPKGVASLVEPIWLFIRNDVIYSNLGKKYGDKYIPYLMTLFFFILINNIIGLIPVFPFGGNTMGNIAVALTLAVLTFLVTLFSSNRHYWKHIFNAPDIPWWMKFPLPLMPLIEFIEVFTKPFVLMIRLFANIVAGHIVVLGFICLVFIFGEIGIGLGYGVSPLTLIFGLFIDLLEILVAFIQAFIFTMLSSIYIAGAVGYVPGKSTNH